jgi:GntR family transcriptional regulator
MNLLSDVAIQQGAPGGQPLYKEVRLRLTQGLMAGEWRPGQAIPSEARLAERFGVSLGTVRKAIDELVAENILLRRQGRGTYVAAHTPDRTMFYFFHITGRDGRKETPSTELLQFQRGRADAEEAAKLGLARGDRVLRICNLLRLGADPVVIDHIVISAQLVPGLDERSFAQREETIYGLYQSRYGINVIRASERLSAALADAETARLLEIAPHTPLLRIARVAYTYHDRPVELRASLVDTTRHEYAADLVKQ